LADSADYEWKDYVYADDVFAIATPFPPTVEKRTVKTKFGLIVARYYSVPLGGDSGLMLTASEQHPDDYKTQDVHRRVGTAVAVGVFTFGVGALTALSKSKKHYVGLTWANGDQKGGLAMQCDKSDYRGVLAGLEGVTGKKAVNSETMTVKN